MGRDNGVDSIASVMSEIDTSGDGQIDFDEFEAWFFKYASTSEQEQLYVVYYESPARAHEEHGQVCETTLDRLPQLLAYGVITAHTRVWMDGMDDWRLLSESSLGGQVNLRVPQRQRWVLCRVCAALLVSSPTMVSFCDLGVSPQSFAATVQQALVASSDDQKTDLLKSIWHNVCVDGTAVEDELRLFLETMGAIEGGPRGDSAFRSITTDMDADGDGQIDFNEFVEWFLKESRGDFIQWPFVISFAADSNAS